MQEKDWMRLQNGSDIRGVAIEGTEGQQVNLTDEAVKGIAAAFVLWLAQKTGKKNEELRISIGTDSRLSAERIKNAAADSIAMMGALVCDCGMASTPAMFMSTVMEGFEYDGAVMVTASHLPYNRNGLKFFTPEGGLEKEDITNILKTASGGKFEPADSLGSMQYADLISAYSELLVKKVRDGVKDSRNHMEPLKGFKIVVDAGNGAGGFFAHKVLVPLGADITGSQFLEPDGHFPSHIPNPEEKEAIDSICEAVKKHDADLGIIFDADVDRAGAVGKGGMEINRNRLIGLLSAIVLEEHPETYIVTDSVTSSGLKKFIEEGLGGIHHRFKRGYKNVINEAIRLNSIHKECHLAMETSGHGALKENYFLDDGAYLMTKILIKMAKLKNGGGPQTGIEGLLRNLKEPKEAREFRMKISCEDFVNYGYSIISDLQKYAMENKWDIAPDNYEGIRVSFKEGEGDGWFLLRMSLHDPILPLNIESDSAGGVKIIASKLYDFIKQYENIDAALLKGYIK